MICFAVRKRGLPAAIFVFLGLHSIPAGRFAAFQFHSIRVRERARSHS